MGEGSEEGLHPAPLPSFPVTVVRSGPRVRSHDKCPCGNFGWVGTPYAFNVVSRTLDVITKDTIEGAGL